MKPANIAPLLVALALAGCSDKDAYREMVLTDELTGCQYLGYVQAGILTTAWLKRRMDHNGKQVCAPAGSAP